MNWYSTCEDADAVEAINTLILQNIIIAKRVRAIIFCHTSFSSETNINTHRYIIGNILKSAQLLFLLLKIDGLAQLIVKLFILISLIKLTNIYLMIILTML